MIATYVFLIFNFEKSILISWKSMVHTVLLNSIQITPLQSHNSSPVQTRNAVNEIHWNKHIV